jgi:two-component system response regulator (stage 0 sporulation protein A)
LRISAGGEKIRILIADDSREFCNALEKFLRSQEQMELVDVCHNGYEILDVLSRRPVDILVMDLIMPHMDGIGVLEKMLTMYLDPLPKVIILTAFGQENVTQQAVRLGADYYMLKPLDLHLLGKRIEQIVRGNMQVGERSFSYRHDTSRPEPKNLSHEVSRMIYNLGVPPHVRGYQYLRDAIILVVEDVNYLAALTKNLYPAVARHHNTTPTRVERGIRNAIELSWERGNCEQINRLFGYAMSYEHGKLTNAEFIAIVSDRLRLDLFNS